MVYGKRCALFFTILEVRLELPMFLNTDIGAKNEHIRKNLPTKIIYSQGKKNTKFLSRMPPNSMHFRAKLGVGPKCPIFCFGVVKQTTSFTCCFMLTTATIKVNFNLFVSFACQFCQLARIAMDNNFYFTVECHQILCISEKSGELSQNVPYHVSG